MELLLKRIARRDSYTIGKLYVNGSYFCDTLEDKDRGLDQSLPICVNRAKKMKGKTAIPVGKYRVTLDVKSERFGKKQQYAACSGKLPRLVNVPAFDGVLIHIGNTSADTEGCILVGRNKVVGAVLQSTEIFWKLYDVLQSAKDTIYIKIE